MHSTRRRLPRAIAPATSGLRYAWLLALAAVVLVLLASACGGEGAAAGANGTPEPMTTVTELATPDGSTQEAAAEEPDAVAFAQCMRANGVTNFPDPQPSGGIRIDGSVASNPNLESALAACEHLRPEGRTGPGSVEPEVLLAFAQCMRDNGVPEFPDPTGAGGGGGMAMGGQGPSGFNPNSPQFQAALDVCGAEYGISINIRPQ